MLSLTLGIFMRKEFWTKVEINMQSNHILSMPSNIMKRQKSNNFQERSTIWATYLSPKIWQIAKTMLKTLISKKESNIFRWQQTWKIQKPWSTSENVIWLQLELILIYKKLVDCSKMLQVWAKHREGWSILKVILDVVFRILGQWMISWSLRDRFF